MPKPEKNMNDSPCAMTVAGSDSGAGAGIQADILTFAACGVYATSAIAAITAQNPSKVSKIGVCEGALLTHQLERIAEFYAPKAAKCGMLFDEKRIRRVADFFEKNRGISLVVDPVFISSSGAKLLEDGALEAMKARLIPLATLITPNIDEACVLGNFKKIPLADMEKCASELARKYGVNVLLKGGHLEGDSLTDVLAAPSGEISATFRARKISGINSHGSGCTLSAAVCAFIARGEGLKNACAKAHKYLQTAMLKPLRVGGEYFINHFANH